MLRLVWRHGSRSILRPSARNLKPQCSPPCTFLSSRMLQTPSTQRSRVVEDDVDADEPPPATEAGFKLREYQEECVQSVLDAIANGRRQVGVSLATGSGKTVIFTELIGRVKSPKSQATQTLILAHRRELIEQAARHCSNRYPDKTVEIEMGAIHASGVADITIASIPSLKNADRLAKFDPNRFKLVLVDEAHHIVASTYLRVLDYFGLVSQSETATPALVGVSATFSRFDGLALGKVIRHIVYHKDYVDMIGEKWLANVLFTTVKSNAKLSRVATGASGDFLSSALSAAVNTNEINLITVRSWLQKARDRKSTIVFCVDLAHVESLTSMFRQHGVDAKFVTGDTPAAIRGERLDAFKQGQFPVLLNCGVFTEGTDIPNIDCVLLARPTKSRNLLVQMIGRGMRLFPGKENCHIIDMVGSLESGIVTTPTLFGLDPDEVLNLSDADSMKELKTRQQSEQKREVDTAKTEQSVNDEPQSTQQTTTKVTFTDYDSVESLLDDSSKERFIRAISTNAWVAVSENKYILQDGFASSYLVVEPSDFTAVELAQRRSSNYLVKDQNLGQPWSVTLVQANPMFKDLGKGSPFLRPRVLAKSEEFETMVRAADTFAGQHFSMSLVTLLKPGAWRERAATKKQLDFLNKFRNDKNQLREGDISKGRATDMIVKIKFGARGLVNRNQGTKRRVEAQEQKTAKLKLRQDREHVRVGPVPVADLERSSPGKVVYQAPP